MRNRYYQRSMVDQLDPGQLDEPMQIIICGEVENTNVFAERTYNTTTLDVKAMVSFGSGNEDLHQNRVSSSQTAEFTIRYRSEVSVDDHFIWLGSKYDIKALRSLGRRRYLICSVELVDN